jgi:hypothetical protein
VYEIDQALNNSNLNTFQRIQVKRSLDRAGLLGRLRIATRGGPDVIVWDRPRPALLFIRDKHNEVD